MCNCNDTVKNFSVLVDDIAVKSSVVQVNDTHFTAALSSEEIPGLNTNMLYAVQIQACSETVCRQSNTESLSELCVMRH